MAIRIEQAGTLPTVGTKKYGKHTARLMYVEPDTGYVVWTDFETGGAYLSNPHDTSDVSGDFGQLTITGGFRPDELQRTFSHGDNAYRLDYDGSGFLGITRLGRNGSILSETGIITFAFRASSAPVAFLVGDDVYLLAPNRLGESSIFGLDLGGGYIVEVLAVAQDAALGYRSG